jgi:hypothetical protein
MSHLIEHLPEILLHTLIDTAKLLPFLFLSYLLMEFLEHRSGNAAEGWLQRSGKIGPLFGGLCGILPQCGFSAAASGLYSGRIITVGTLLSVYLATSDEMLPILISHGADPLLILKLLGSKLLVGVVAGFAVDALYRLIRRRRHYPEQEPQIEELCEREHCRCEDHFALSALKHTLQIALFILLFNLLLNLVIHGVGEEKLGTLLSDLPVLGNVLAALVGLIPNCASSVVLTELYLASILPVGATLSGLLVNAGIGLVVLFRNNRPFSDSLRVLLLLLLIGISVGILVDLTPLHTVF